MQNPNSKGKKYHVHIGNSPESLSQDNLSRDNLSIGRLGMQL